MSVKPHHLLSLLQGDFVTIAVRFSPETVPVEQMHPRHNRQGNSTGDTLMASGKLYTYKHRGPVAVGDTVVVDSPGSGLVCVTVIEVHGTPQIDLDAGFTYKWTVQRVDKAEYLANLDREEKFAEQIAQAQRINQRHQLLHTYADAFPAGTPARAEFDRAVAEFNPRLADEMKALGGDA